MSVAGPALPAGWRLEIHDALPSTQDLVVARAEAGEPPGLAVLARRQTAGRGRRGRDWNEPPGGNLAVTLLLDPGADPDAGAAWPFLSGLALLEALEAAVPGAHGALALKWPNDVMLGGRKLAGILLERGGTWLAMGFGANLAEAPVVPGRETACLAELGAAPAPEVVAARLMAAVDRWRALRERDGSVAVLRAWEARAHPRGARLAVRAAGDQIEGSFAGIAEDGALLLDTGDVIRRFASAEVSSAPDR